MPPPPRPPAEQPRRSHAFEHLSAWLTSNTGLQVVDFGGVNQSNLDFLTGLGHRLYADDLLRAADHFFAAKTGQKEEERYSAANIEEFLSQTLDFPDQTIDAVLLWDTLQYLNPALALALVERLYRASAPDCRLLAFFQPASPTLSGTPVSCRILDESTLETRPRGTPRKQQTFNNRGIEKLFQRFQSVKFFLTRDHVQEVIVRR